MSQTGGGYLLDLYTQIRTAEERREREEFRTKLKEFVELVDSYGEPFDGHQTLLQILLKHNEDFELSQKGDTTRRDLAVYLYHKYDEYKKGLIAELPPRCVNVPSSNSSKYLNKVNFIWYTQTLTYFKIFIYFYLIFI